jgi:hypothetical protein
LGGSSKQGTQKRERLKTKKEIVKTAYGTGQKCKFNVGVEWQCKKLKQMQSTHSADLTNQHFARTHFNCLKDHQKFGTELQSKVKQSTAQRIATQSIKLQRRA